MGKNNKARRAAKAKERSRARSGSGQRNASRGASGPGGAGGGWGRDHGAEWSDPGDPFGDPLGDQFDEPFGQAGWAGRPPPREEDLAGLLLEAAQTAVVGRNPRGLLEQIDAVGTRIASEGADRAATLVVDRSLDRVWAVGWQPAEVVRQMRLGCDRPTERAVRHAIAGYHAGRPDDTLDARWRDQLTDLKLPRVGAEGHWLTTWAASEELGVGRALRQVVQLIAALSTLPAVDVLIPRPGATGVSPPPSGSWLGGAADGGSVADPVLERIRALLAKAESTTFEAEATAFTAKAQELMTRHAIDSARIAATAPNAHDQPISARVPVDPPYVDAKSLLLQHVASATRCRSLILQGLSMSVVVGFPDDVRAVEMLFTSLLVQAQSALSEAARHAPPGTRVRGQGYRSAFLLSYATRIGARLTEINQAVVDAEAAQDAGFLPVLRSRSEAVDAAIDDRYGELGTSRVRGGHDAMGWDHGRRAADEARLNAGHLAS